MRSPHLKSASLTLAALTFSAMLLSPATASAQTAKDGSSTWQRTVDAYSQMFHHIFHTPGIKAKVDKSIDAFEKITPQDSAYIVDPNPYKWMVRTRVMPQSTRMFYSYPWSSNVVENDLQTPWKVYHSISATYRRLTLNAAFSPYKSNFKEKDLNLGITAKVSVIDFYYRESHNFKGTSSDSDMSFDIIQGSAGRKSYGYDGFLILNPKRYSAQAVRLNIKEQIRSAGSFLLASSGNISEFSYGSMMSLGMPEHTVKLRSISFGGGYAYNWVPAPGVLVHASLIESLMLLGSAHINIDGLDSHLVELSFPSHYTTGVVNISKSFDSKWFLGAEFLCSRMSFKGTDSFLLRTSKLQGQVYVGVRF